MAGRSGWCCVVVADDPGGLWDVAEAMVHFQNVLKGYGVQDCDRYVRWLRRAYLGGCRARQQYPRLRKFRERTSAFSGFRPVDPWQPQSSHTAPHLPPALWREPRNRPLSPENFAGRPKPEVGDHKSLNRIRQRVRALCLNDRAPRTGSWQVDAFRRACSATPCPVPRIRVGGTPRPGNPT